jgi:hypothetical protein
MNTHARPQAVPKASANGAHTPSFSKSPPHQSKTIEYTSSAPQPPTSHAQNGEEDEDVPTHLYEKLPGHLLENGKPDYLRMILMCELGMVRLVRGSAHGSQGVHLAVELARNALDACGEPVSSTGLRGEFMHPFQCPAHGRSG